MNMDDEIFVDDNDVVKYSKLSRSNTRLWNEDPADYVHNGISSSWDGSIEDENLENSYIYHELHELKNYLTSNMMGTAEQIIYENSYVPLPKELLNSYIDDYVSEKILEVSFEFPYEESYYHNRDHVKSCNYAISNVIFDDEIEDRTSVKEIDDIHKFEI